ncbi:hypothetical protein V8B97DRAFT_1876404 [Scleroderma yunnanense]
MFNNSAYSYNDGYNHDFTDADAEMLVSIASSPEHRFHTCRWVDNVGSCGTDIPGNYFPVHFRERHGINIADVRPMRCQWEGCMEFISGVNLFPHMQQKHLPWKYPCIHCGMEFPRKAMRNAHHKQCKTTGN